MNDQKDKAMGAVDVLIETMDVLDPALECADFDKAHEAVSVLLMQVMDLYGADGPVFQQFYPGMESIKNAIDTENSKGALNQSRLFRKQLEEVKVLIRNGI